MYHIKGLREFTFNDLCLKVTRIYVCLKNVWGKES